MMAEEKNTALVWKEPVTMWMMLGIAAALIGYIFFDGIERMEHLWSTKEEYGYAYILPLITAFFIWSKKDKLGEIEFTGSWIGVIVLVSGIFLFVLGELSTIYVVIEYALILVIAALALSLTGWRGFREIWVPIFILVFMVPLPNFIYQGLSSQLQLISSELGVAFIRLLNISVYLEGNVIDLGNYRLQVVEACSGLRYLFPLASLAFIAAYIFKAAAWKRVVVFLSSIPITIFMNSFRIGVIGVLVDKWGTSQAEGFLHYFEGWVIFMACLVILFLEIWILSRFGSDKQSFSNVFTLDFPDPTPEGTTIRKRKVPAAFIASLLLIIVAVPLTASLEQRKNISPDRSVFSEFPAEINGWKSTTESLEQIYLDALKLDDYYLADFKSGDSQRGFVNLYMAYYASQSKGDSAHSPRTCIPGGGWEIKEITQRTLDGVDIDGIPLTVNRLEIRKGGYRQLVYYWFEGRGRIITNEYMVKWFIFWDALTKNRTDGALVRLSIYLGPYDSIDSADKVLTSFAKDVSGYLGSYIPN